MCTNMFLYFVLLQFAASAASEASGTPAAGTSVTVTATTAAASTPSLVARPVSIDLFVDSVNDCMHTMS